MCGGLSLMPEHHLFPIEKIGEDTFTYEPPITPDAARRVVINHGKIQLRRLDVDEKTFAPWGVYKESWVIFPNYKASGISDLYGFETIWRNQGQCKSDAFGGEVSFQLSNDNGTTWYTIDSGAWVEATGPLANTWATIQEVDLHIPDFPLTEEKQIRVKMRLTPADSGNSTPQVWKLSFFVGLDYDFTEDILRSTKHHLEDNVRVEAFVAGEVVHTDLFAPEHQWEILDTPAEIYNVTTDPDKTTNLFDSFDNGAIRLTSEQTGFLQGRIHARPPVYIEAAEDFIEISQNPAIIISDTTITKLAYLQNGAGETDYARERGLCRDNITRTYFDAQLRVHTQSAVLLESKKLTDAVHRALTQYEYILSEATGETMPIPSVTPDSLGNRVATGLFSKTISCTLYGKAWLRNDLIRDGYLARELVVLTSIGEVSRVTTERMEIS